MSWNLTNEFTITFTKISLDLKRAIRPRKQRQN